MAHLMGESETGVLRLDFDRRLKLEFHGSKVTSDAGLLPFRELDDALGLSEVAGKRLVDPRAGKNGQHGMTGLFRQSTFGRLGGFDEGKIWDLANRAIDARQKQNWTKYNKAMNEPFAHAGRLEETDDEAIDQQQDNEAAEDAVIREALTTAAA